METPNKKSAYRRKSAASEAAGKAGDDVSLDGDVTSTSNAGNISLRATKKNKIISTQTTTTSRKKRAVSTMAFPAKSASDYLTPELFGIVSSFLESATKTTFQFFEPEVAKLVAALEGANCNGAYYKAAIVEIHRSNPEFSECCLEAAYNKLPGKNNNPSHYAPSCDGYYESPDERAQLYKKSGKKVRRWIQVNPDLWKQRIAVSSLDNAIAYAARCDNDGNCSPFHSMIVEQKVANKLDIPYSVGPDECRYKVASTSDKAFEKVYGMCLIAVNGESVHSLEVPSGNEWEARHQVTIHDYIQRSKDRDWYGNFLPGKGGPLHLLFMPKGDVFFNEILAVVRCDLVEILREMYKKGLVSATSRLNNKTKYPLLWHVYFNAPSNLCFNFLLSQEDVDCNITSQQSSYSPYGATLLIEASKVDEYPIGIDAYDALAKHPKTNVNAQVKESSMYFGKGDTALHAVVSQLKWGRHCGDTLVHMTKVLIEAGADPNMKSEENGTVIDYFRKMRRRNKSSHFIKTSEKHLDEMEALLTRPPKKPSKPSPKKITVDPRVKALYVKWRKDARERGGHYIIVEKGAAKKLAFDTLICMARPVTLLQLYEEMKAVVPLPILRKCLDHMETKPNYNLSYNLTGQSKASDEYDGTIRVDKGKKSNNTFYSIANETVTKKLIFDTLQEFACPVTIEELYYKMKGAVPLPLLRVLLDEMLDKSKNIGVDDESMSKESTCRYSGSVFVEEGRDSNNSFFYVNPTPAGLSEDIDAVEEDDEFEGADTFEEDDEFEGIDNFNDDELEGTNDFCLMKKRTAEAADAENDKDTEATTLQEDKGKSTVVGFTSAWSQL